MMRRVDVGWNAAGGHQAPGRPSRALDLVVRRGEVDRQIEVPLGGRADADHDQLVRVRSQDISAAVTSAQASDRGDRGAQVKRALVAVFNYRASFPGRLGGVRAGQLPRRDAGTA